MAGAVLRVLRCALRGWEALESDLAEAAGPGLDVPEEAANSARSATQAVLDALTVIAIGGQQRGPAAALSPADEGARTPVRFLEGQASGPGSSEGLGCSLIDFDFVG